MKALKKFLLNTQIKYLLEQKKNYLNQIKFASKQINIYLPLRYKMAYFFLLNSEHKSG